MDTIAMHRVRLVPGPEDKAADTATPANGKDRRASQAAAASVPQGSHLERLAARFNALQRGPVSEEAANQNENAGGAGASDGILLTMPESASLPAAPFADATQPEPMQETMREQATVAHDEAGEDSDGSEDQAETDTPAEPHQSDQALLMHLPLPLPPSSSFASSAQTTASTFPPARTPSADAHLSANGPATGSSPEKQAARPLPSLNPSAPLPAATSHPSGTSASDRPIASRLSTPSSSALPSTLSSSTPLKAALSPPAALASSGFGASSEQRAVPNAAFATASNASTASTVAAVANAFAMTRSAAPVAASASNAGVGDAPPVIDAIVSRLADFCADPAVFERGAWHVTVPLQNVLPDCVLHVALSHFDLTLRFETSNESAKTVLLQHASSLRDRLTALLKTKQTTPRGIEIIVR